MHRCGRSDSVDALVAAGSVPVSRVFILEFLGSGGVCVNVFVWMYLYIHIDTIYMCTCVCIEYMYTHILCITSVCCGVTGHIVVGIKPVTCYESRQRGRDWFGARGVRALFLPCSVPSGFCVFPCFCCVWFFAKIPLVWAQPSTKGTVSACWKTGRGADTVGIALDFIPNQCKYSVFGS